VATDIGVILDNLTAFYDFSNKAVIHVGAGGGQLIGYAGRCRSVLGVDPDAEAVDRLKDALSRMGLRERFAVEQCELGAVSAVADVVFFEFCLHEMEDPEAALEHARTLAPEILVLDHLPDSPWSWYTCEAEKAARSWTAVHARAVARELAFHAVQRFDDHARLLEKVRVLGEEAIRRAAELAGKRKIEIGMSYAAALLRSTAT
jgi:hypothetical protein